MFSSIKSSTRIALTIGAIFVGVLWVAAGLRMMPNPKQTRMPGRVNVCETLAITTSTLAETKSAEQIKRILQNTLDRNPEILSIGLRDQQGQLLYSVGPHHTWSLEKSQESNSDMMKVTILQNRRKWASLELQFKPISTYGPWVETWYPLPLILFCGSGSMLLVWLYLSRILKHLNPSKVVPTRVRTAFEALAEGLILTDPDNRIVLANGAFKRMISSKIEDPQGVDPASLDWTDAGRKKVKDFPWSLSFREGREHRGTILTHVDGDGKVRKFIVNSTPVFGENDKCRGVLTSFDDVTVLEEKQDQLVKTLKVLQGSRDEIKRQNKELQVLASVDPLSGCLNRRSFFEKFQILWGRGDMLSTIMVDIDFFKKINDNHGHAVGDSFIRGTGDILRKVVGKMGIVCRYGGEEFCILLMGIDIEKASDVAWKINRAIESTLIEELPFTASLGVSARRNDTTDAEQLLDQADKSLYAAKRRGRNQVVAWTDVRVEDLNSGESQSDSHDSNANESGEDCAPQNSYFGATVDSLLTALAYRDRGTAEHCRRVANVAVAVAKDILEPDEINDLETAALLHDIGKVGVPDAILLKPGPLTENEWTIMRQHDAMSHDIVRAANAGESVEAIVRTHHDSYNHEDNNDSPSLSTRIVSVCDAFDAMTNDRVYRKGMTFKDAFDELRASAPEQFDPTVVELLIHAVTLNPDCMHSKTLEETAPVRSGQIEGQVLRLQEAMRSGESRMYPTLLHQLVAFSGASNFTPQLQDATGKLQAAMEYGDSEIQNLISLTEDVLQISRAAQNQDIISDHGDELQIALQ